MLAAVDWASILVGALVSAVAGLLLAAVWLRGTVALSGWFRQRYGEVRGKWYSTLSPFDDSPERVDEMLVRQRGPRIWGTIERVRPGGHKGKWRFRGYTHGNVVVCVFYTTFMNDPSSYGVICVHRDPRQPGTYRGYYTRPDFEGYEKFLPDGDGLSRRPIVWTRQDPRADHHH
jgi:hypothetical protein